MVRMVPDARLRGTDTTMSLTGSDRSARDRRLHERLSRRSRGELGPAARAIANKVGSRDMI